MTDGMKKLKESDPEKYFELIEKIANDECSIVFKDEITGEEETIALNVYLIGRFFVNLESTRDALGHKTMRGTLDYVDTKGSAELRYLRDIIARDAYRPFSVIGMESRLKRRRV